MRIFINTSNNETKTWVYYPDIDLVFKYYQDDWGRPSESVYSLEDILGYDNWIELKELNENATN